jgi:poly(A) polymerase
MSRGIAAGPELGAALRLAEEFWIEADFPMDRAALDALADRATREASVRLRL